MPLYLNNGYQNNPNLPKASYKHQFTQTEYDEFKKCRLDVVHFARKYIKIVTLDKGMVPFDLWNFQEDMLRTIQNNRFTITKYPRQTGKTSTVVAYLLHQALFHKNFRIAILANKGSTAREIMERLQFAFEYLPMFLKQGIVTWNKGSITFANGSKIIAAATSASGVRGSTYNIVFLDEFAHVQKNVADAFFDSTYPVISSGKTTQVIIVSTPLGMNKFYTMWQKAIKKKSSYIPIEVHWSQVPGRDEAWKKETIDNTSEEQFRQEFETEFLGSSNTLISGSKLAMLLEMTNSPIFIEGDATFKVYEHAKPKGVYVIAVDTSRGQGKDFQAFSVIDVSQIPFKQVATYKNNKISPLIFPTVIYNVAKKFNEAFVLVEINDIGSQIADILHYELVYENLVKVSMNRSGKLGQQVGAGYTKRTQFGVKTSVQTKKIGCANLKTMIENDKLTVPDEGTVEEFLHFVADKDSFNAEEGYNDDLVMTLVLFSWLAAQKYFKESVNQNIRQVLQEEILSVNDLEIIPFGIIDDGLNDTGMKMIDKDGTIWYDAKERKYVGVVENKHVEIDDAGNIWYDDRQKMFPWDDLSWRNRL
jgi:hypothetical protein